MRHSTHFTSEKSLGNNNKLKNKEYVRERERDKKGEYEVEFV